MIDKITINGVTYHVTPTTAPQLGDQVVTIDGVIYIIGEPLVEAQNTSGDIERARVGGQGYDIRDAVLLPLVQQNANAIADEKTRAQLAEQQNATAIADETTRARAAERELQKQINELPTTGGGGTGEIADGSITENKLSFDVKNKLDTAYDRGTIANSLFINDGIELYKGALVKNSDPYTGTSYEMYSNKILANGENVVLAEGFKFTSYKVFKGDTEIFYSDLSGNELTLEDKGYIYQLGIAKSNNSSIAFTDFSTVIKSFIRKPYTWDNTSNLNNFTPQGRYTISGSRVANAQDNMPIYNAGNIEAKLEVLVDGTTVAQKLTLLNAGGGDGNVYTRVKQDGAWKPWGKLQTNIEVGSVGLGQEKTFDNLTDNGIYSGVNVYSVGSDNNGYPVTSFETFVLVVINAYLTGGGVAQLKYSLTLDGVVSIRTRKKTGDTWSEWADK